MKIFLGSALLNESGNQKVVTRTNSPSYTGSVKYRADHNFCEACSRILGCIGGVYKYSKWKLDNIE